MPSSQLQRKKKQFLDSELGLTKSMPADLKWGDDPIVRLQAEKIMITP